MHQQCLEAAVHRVTAPKDMKNRRDGKLSDKYSVVFFAKASAGTSAGPWSESVSHECPAEYDEIVALEYL